MALTQTPYVPVTYFTEAYDGTNGEDFLAFIQEHGYPNAEVDTETAEYLRFSLEPIEQPWAKLTLWHGYRIQRQWNQAVCSYIEPDGFAGGYVAAPTP